MPVEFGYNPLSKYSSARDDILHYMCQSDWANESSGNSEAPTGYFWRISNTPEQVQISNTETTSLLEEWFKDVPEVTDSPELRAVLVGYFIVQIVDSGMVYVMSYENEAEMLAAYDALETQYAAWDEPEDDEPTYGDLYS